MADTTPVSMRLDKSVVERLDAWAAAHGASRTGACEALLRRALAEDADPDAAPMTRADLRALQAQIHAAGDALAAAVAAQPVQVAAALPSAEDAERARREAEEAGRAEGAEAERARVAAMGWLERRRYLRG